MINIDTVHAGYEYSRLGTLYRSLYSRLNSIPGVESASFSDYSPFNQCCWAFSVSVQGYTPKPQEQTRTLLNRISPRYFQTLGTKILFGRTFAEHDSPGSHAIAVVTKEFVRRFMPNQNPVGRRFGIGGPRHAGDFEIVGVVDDAKYEDPREDVIPMAFFPLLQPMPGESLRSPDPSNFVKAIEVRTGGRPETMAAAIRRTLADIDPDLPVLQIRTLSEDVKLTLNQDNVIAAMAAFFGAVALVLSCLGLYGLMAYTVQRRTGEIGIRMALGAQRVSVIRIVMREALLQAVAGLIIGVPAAIAVMRLVSNQLYGVSPSDPKYSAGAALILLLCVMAAACAPAAQAARIDPLVAIRYE